MDIFNIAKWKTFVHEDGSAEVYCAKCSYQIYDTELHKRLGKLPARCPKCKSFKIDRRIKY